MPIVHNASTDTSDPGSATGNTPELSEVMFGNETWFQITGHDQMRPFFMNVVSDANHWMFISSNGGLSAGRKNSEHALFPYYTDDKITESAEITGSKTIFRIHSKGGGAPQVWEPFSDRFTGRYRITRNLSKNFHGNKIMFEEVNHDLGLTFRYQWNSSNLYGFVRRAELRNHSGEECRVTVLDGLQNLLPFGVDPELQKKSSNLVDAYKRSELVEDSGLGIYALSAIIVDKTEPSEALKANVVFSIGLSGPSYLLSSLQLNAFRNGKTLREESDVKGEKGAYFVIQDLRVDDGDLAEWMMVANVNQDHSGIEALHRAITERKDLKERILQDVERGTRALQELVAGADGLRKSADIYKDARHYSNVLFNIMRGGTFDHNYRIERSDLLLYLRRASRKVYSRHHALIQSFGDKFTCFELRRQIHALADPDLYRLCVEYLPLKFSRRHGDPSRPWNKFSINTHSDLDGSKVLDYEGNWRDIFQNWEALVHSYPGFIDGMINKFLNASTFDGYNPYRVTKDGFDWEIMEPENPWSYIGYWGDHQIIYMLKFLEFFRAHRPGEIDDLLESEHFVYANIPYRIKAYDSILTDPKNTIDFDFEEDRLIRERVADEGADGALLGSAKHDIYHVNFVEKILASILAKLSNFIPEAGIWMNTQRPEWNDANNALVGNGASMVTLYYLRRFLKFFEEVLRDSGAAAVRVSVELAHQFGGIRQVLDDNRGLLGDRIDDQNRRRIADALGRAGSDYRTLIYERGFSGEKALLPLQDVAVFASSALAWLEHSTEVNRRRDKLFHAYNIISMTDTGMSVSALDEMLEGQVAVLSSGYLDTAESVALLDALRASALYREDQNSYMLYPNRALPRFLEKNRIPSEQIHGSELLQQLVRDGDTRLVRRDINGVFHFNGAFRNAADVTKVLDEFRRGSYAPLVEKDFHKVLGIFEDVFNHKAFTGRSGTFFAYEGLGSIYWHMVSKLHVAVFEVYQRAVEEGACEAVLEELAQRFHEVGEGIGVHKRPEEYGAFPTDAYSHTPWHRGAQQPGMTGQVKEDILAAWGELGIMIREGVLRFNPRLLRGREFSEEAQVLEFVDIGGQTREVTVPPHGLCFSCCQVPVVYRLGGEVGITVDLADGSTRRFRGGALDPETSGEVFNRSGKVSRITYGLTETTPT